MIVGSRIPDFASSWATKLFLRGSESLGSEWTPGVRMLTTRTRSTSSSTTSLRKISKCVSSSKHLRTVRQCSSCLDYHRCSSSSSSFSFSSAPPAASITNILSIARRLRPFGSTNTHNNNSNNYNNNNNTHGSQFRLFHTTPLSLASRNSKYSFDPDIGSDAPEFKKRFFTVNDAVVFKHFNEKGRRLPRVYLWGSTETGQLGNRQFVHPSKPKVKGDYSLRDERAKKLKTPDPIPVVTWPWRSHVPDYYDLNISHVCAGHGYTVMVNSNNKAKTPRVLGTGLNFESQLGCVRMTDKYSGEEKIIDILLEPTDIHLPLTDPLSKVTQVACGRAHSVFLTEEGVFTMGSNSQGQCGRKVIENEIFRGNSVVHKIEEIPDPVVQVACGLDHTLFLTSAGSVYACGWGADGQTGLGHYDRVDAPTLVKGDLEGVKIRHLACKADCVLAVSEDGDLFGWGNSEYNQLSLVTPSTQVRYPRRLPFNVGRVTKAAAGASACAILTQTGQVYVWGFGILGLGPNVESLSEPQPLPPPLFGITPLSPELTVVDIEAGMSHFAAIVETPKKVLDHRLGKEIPPFRELYTWGANRRGCLGLGREDNQPFPLKVVLKASVGQVSCGTNHTVALCDPLLL